MLPFWRELTQLFCQVCGTLPVPNPVLYRFSWLVTRITAEGGARLGSIATSYICAGEKVKSTYGQGGFVRRTHRRQLSRKSDSSFSALFNAARIFDFKCARFCARLLRCADTRAWRQIGDTRDRAGLSAGPGTLHREGLTCSGDNCALVPRL